MAASTHEDDANADSTLGREPGLRHLTLRARRARRKVSLIDTANVNQLVSSRYASVSVSMLAHAFDACPTLTVDASVTLFSRPQLTAAAVALDK